MAFKDFSEEQYIKTINTGETPRLGTFKVLTSGELVYMRVKLYINGLFGGSEQVRLKINSDTAYSSALYTSDWSEISEVVDENDAAITGNWLGWIRIDFNNENINKNLTYYVSAEFANYTRNAGTFYLGLAYDFPYSIYDNSENLFYNHPLAMELFLRVERS